MAIFSLLEIVRFPVRVGRFFLELFPKYEAFRSLEPSTSRLGLANDFRTLGWEEVFKYPEVVLGQMKELLEFTLKT